MPAKAKPVRKPLPDHLPRITQEHAPACACASCGTALRRIGVDVSEHLEFVPEHFKVIRTVRPKMSCPKCSTVVQVPAPSRPIPKAIAGPGLLAHVVVSKYVDHLPLYRQSEIYARQGVDLDRSTMAGWIGAMSALVQPLVDALGRYVIVAPRSTPTTPRFRFWILARARPRPGDCGYTFGMIGPPVARIRRRPGIDTARREKSAVPQRRQH